MARDFQLSNNVKCRLHCTAQSKWKIAWFIWNQSRGIGYENQIIKIMNYYCSRDMRDITVPLVWWCGCYYVLKILYTDVWPGLACSLLNNKSSLCTADFNWHLNSKHYIIFTRKMVKEELIQYTRQIVILLVFLLFLSFVIGS